MTEPNIYEGNDLEILAATPRYQEWVMEYFRPHVHGKTVEIGAGIGTVSQHMLELATSLHLVEPSTALLDRLRGRFAGQENVEVIGKSLESYIQSADNSIFDTVVMVNVLEHIEDDMAAVNDLYRMQPVGGKLLLFVPAMPFLFSKLDKFYGHYRRYRRDTLSKPLLAAGYSIVQMRYLDLGGVLPWYLLNTLGGKTDFNLSLVRLYDAVGVPVTKAFERLIPPPLGKNLMVVAKK